MTVHLPNGFTVTRLVHVAHECGWTVAVPATEPWRIRHAMAAHVIEGCMAEPADTPEG